MAAFPNKPGAVASYILEFVAPHDLNNGVDEIIITWDKNFKNFPSVIATSAVSISASAVTGGGSAGEAVAPEEVNVDFVTPENADLQPQTLLRVSDMDTDDNSGGNGIAAGATVTVVFRQAAGITNSSENDLLNLDVRVTDGSGVDGGATDDTRRKRFIPTRMQMSNNDGKRGKSFTLIASGIEGSESITFFRDANGNGIRDVNERDVCNVVADSDDTATCTFTISNPPFVPGKGDDCTLPELNNCNFINFVEAEGRTTTGGTATLLAGGDPTTKDQPLDQEAVDRQVLELDQTIMASPDQGFVGDTLVISLFDWPANRPIDRIELAGIDVTPGGLPSTGGSGEVSFQFQIPGKGNNGETIPFGLQPLKVFTDAGTPQEASEDTKIEILMPGPPIASLSIVQGPISGPVGTLLNARGSFFLPGQEVTITFGGVLVDTVTASSTGEIDTVFQVPNVSPGSHVVMVGVALVFEVTPTIHACFTSHKTDAEKQGQLRIVSDPANCQQGETPISWNP